MNQQLNQESQVKGAKIDNVSACLVMEPCRYLKNVPEGEDLFGSKAQSELSEEICTDVQSADCRVIGIDGPWGAGKSNIIQLIGKRLAPKNFLLFVYDAWGHQEDLNRRSILEELTEYLKGAVVSNKVFENKLKELFACKRETQKKTIPKISMGLVSIVMASFLFLILDKVVDKFVSADWVVEVMLIPLIFPVFVFVYYFYKEKSSEVKFFKRSKEKFKKAAELFLSMYKDYCSEEILHEVISESEPSVSQFRNWMEDLSTNLENKHLIIVFDNLDRLPSEKVKELWSMIHLFFAEKTYSNITVIVPFDRMHINAAFLQENPNDSYADDYIDKTFSVIHRVPPPILSDWKDFFKTKWDIAFSEKYNSNEYDKVVQQFGLFVKNIMPRKIIAFINEFILLKKRYPNMQDQYLSLFLLNKSKILIDPIKEIVNPSYLGAMEKFYRNDHKLPNYMAALTYQISVERALHVVYKDTLINALNEQDLDMITQIGQLEEFPLLLQDAVTSVTDTENAIVCLHRADFKISESVWESLYKILEHEPISGQKVSHAQLAILRYIKEPRIYVGKMLKEYAASFRAKSPDSFSPRDYYESIKKIEEVYQEVTDEEVDQYLIPIQLDPVSFLEFLKYAGEEYEEFRVDCPDEDLDSYLTKINTYAELEKIESCKYSAKKLPQFCASLKEIIEKNPDSQNMEFLLQMLKEIIKATPIKLNISDADLYQLRTNISVEDELVYDLVSIRISKFKNFPISYAKVFENDLNNINENFVKGVYKCIEYYANYGDILFNLSEYSKYPLYRRIAQLLTKKNLSEKLVSRLNLVKTLQIFDDICSYGKIESKTLFQRLNMWQVDELKNISVEQLPVLLPSTTLFKEANESNNKLATVICEKGNSYLNNLTKEKWVQVLRNINSYEYRLIKILKFKYNKEVVNAIDSISQQIANGVLTLLEEHWKFLLSKLSCNDKRRIFNSVSQVLCECTNFDRLRYLSLFGDLIEFGNLEKYPAAIDRIFTYKVLKMKTVQAKTVEYSEQLIKVFRKMTKENKYALKSLFKRLESGNKNSEEFNALLETIKKTRIRK